MRTSCSTLSRGRSRAARGTSGTHLGRKRERISRQLEFSSMTNRNAELGLTLSRRDCFEPCSNMRGRGRIYLPGQFLMMATIR